MAITLSQLRSQIQLPQEITPDVPFWDTVAAQIGYTYDPIIEAISNQKNFPDVDLEYFPVQDLEGYEEFSSSLLYARSAEHMASLKRGIDENKKRRETLANSGLWANLGAGVLDPINFIALPMGAPALMGRQALRSAATLGIFQSGLETIRAPFDALSTADEVALNVAFASVAGGLIGGATAVPRTIRNRGLKNLIKDADDKLEDSIANKYYHSMTDEEVKFASRKKTRQEFKSKTNQDLKNELNANNNQIFGFEQIIQTNQWPDGKQISSIALENVKKRKQSFEIANTKILQERAIRRVTETNLKSTDKYGIAAGGWISKLISKPTTRQLSAAIPDKAKKTFLKLSYDAGLKLNLHNANEILDPSVQQLKALHNGRWVKIQQDSIKHYGEFINTKIKTYGGLQFNDVGTKINNRFKNTNDVTHESFVIEATRKKLFDEESSAAEIKFQEDLFGEFKKYGEELVDQGIIGRKRSYQSSLEEQRIKLDQTIDNFAKHKNPQPDWIDHHAKIVGQIKAKINDLEESLAYTQYLEAKGIGITPSGETLYFPHIFNKIKAKKEPEGLKKILYNHYENNPVLLRYTNGKIEEIKLSKDPKEIEKRVINTYNKIIGEDVRGEVPITSGGSSRHFKHRELNIPTREIWDYLVQDPLAVFKGYSEKAAGRIEYSKAHNRLSVHEVMDEEINDMYAAGVSSKLANQWRKDYFAMYQRIVTSPKETDPSRLDNATAFWLKEAATFSYLESAGLAAIPDFAKIVMEHDMGDIIKGIQALINDSSVTLNAREAKLVGEATELFQNNAHLRIVEDVTGDIRSSNAYDKIKNTFFLANGLAPITHLAKALDGTIRSHSLIDMSVKFRDKKITDWEKTYLATYGIDEQKAIEIANAPHQKTNKGFYLANTEDWENNYQFPKTDSIIQYGETRKYTNNIYQPASYSKKTNTIKFDVDFIKGQFPAKPWLNPKLKGVKALPEFDAKGNLTFESPQMWANFVLQKEILRGKFAPEDFNIPQIPKDAPVDFKKLIKENYPISMFKDATDPSDILTPEAIFENILNDVALRVHKEQPKMTKETLDTFRTALQTGIMNTVILGTPADKPIIVDGAAYIPMGVAKQFNMKEHDVVKGYARIESGLLAFPFQFYSYSLGALNKITTAAAQNRLKNRMLGLSLSLGLGMMIVKTKTPDFAFEDMTWRDWFARGFDQGGIAALYTDIMYQSMQTSLAMGGPNISGGLIQPKFREDNGMAAAIGLGGAGPSIAYDYAESLKQLLYDRNFGEGAKNLWRTLPFTGMWFWKDTSNEFSNNFKNW